MRLPQLDTSSGTGVATALCDVQVVHVCRLDHDGCCQLQYIQFVDTFRLVGCAGSCIKRKDENERRVNTLMTVVDVCHF